MNQTFQKRVKRVKKALTQQKRFDALLVSKPENIHYISGYHGHDAWLLLTANKFYLITDSRYTEEAEKYFARSKTFQVEILYPRMGRTAIIKKVLKKHRANSLGVEMMHLVFGAALQLRKDIAPRKVVAVSSFIESLRMIKDEKEIAAIRKAVQLDQKVFGYLRRIIRPGMTEAEVVQKAEAKMREVGGDGPSYATIIASAWKAALPHAVSDGHKIKKNDMLLIDMGTNFRGYVSDLTRTFFLGRMPSLFKDRYSKVLEAQELALSGLRPGLPIGEFEKKVRKYFSKFRYEQKFCHSLGHGIGLEIHELPWVNAFNQMPLREGMVITIEPGLYFPGWGGIRIEDDVLITKSGYEVLSTLPKSLKSMALN